MKKSNLIIAAFCAAIFCHGAIVISTSSPIRPGGVIVSGKADVRPHSGYSALVATEKWNYKPLEIRLNNAADDESGIFSMEYYPYFSKPGTSVLLWRSGDVKLELSEKSITMSAGKEKYSAAALFQPGVWYGIKFTWEDGVCKLNVDGKDLISFKNWQLPVGKTLFLGGMPDGLLRNITIDRPRLSPVVQLGGGKKLEFTIRADNKQSFCFDYFAHGEAQKLRLCPSMPIYPGEKFVLIQSCGDPIYLTAVKAGELEVQLPPSYSNRVEMRRDKGNLFADPSFEKFPANWHILSQMEYAKATAANAAVKGKIKPQIPAAKSDSVTFSTKDVRTGKGAVLISRNRNYGQITMVSKVPVAANTRYLLHVYYKALECSDYKCSLILQVKIYDGSKMLKHFRKYHPSSPLRRSGNWEIAPMMFETPAANGKLTAEVELISDSEPCRIALDDISLREYPTLHYNPMPPDVDRVKKMTGKALLDHIAKRPTVKLPSAPMSAVSGYDGNIYKMMDRSGADILFVKVNVDHRWRRQAWETDGSYDFSGIDEQILHVLSYAPDAVIGLAIGLEAPLDFGIRYPEAAWRSISGRIEYMNTPDQRFYPERRGKKFPYVSYTAPDYRREAGKFLYALGKYLKGKPWGKTIAGIQLVGGGDGQWFYRPRKNDFADMMDFSAGNLKAMRQVIRRYYGNDLNKLRKAWGEPGVTFDTITFPRKSLYGKYSYLRDPAVPEIRKVIDFARLYPQAITESLGFIASEFERGMGRKIIKARYYFGTSLGHLLEKSPFDMLISVPPYGVSRLHGHAGRLHQAPGSVKLYNKIYLDELDLRTSYSPMSAYGTTNSFRHNGVEHGPDGFANMMRKMAAPNLIANQGYWYMMIGGNASLQQEMEPHVKESFDAVKAGSGREIVDPGSPIAMFWDEEARVLMGERFGWAVEQHSIHQLQKLLSRTGFGYQMYLLKDLAHPKRPAAKVNIFPLASSMDEKQISYVEKNLQKDGNVLVFAFDAGRTAPGGFEKNIYRLTGIRVKSVGVNGVSSFSTAKFPGKLAGYVTPATPIFNGPFSLPLYCVDDDSAEPLALIARTNMIGAAIKRHKNWTAVYVSIPLGMAVKPEFFRELAMAAGLKPNAPAQDVSYFGNGYMVIHAVSSGKKVLTWERAADVIDLTSGKIIKRKAVNLTLDMKFGETRWFRLVKPEKK